MLGMLKMKLNPCSIWRFRRLVSIFSKERKKTYTSLNLSYLNVYAVLTSLLFYNRLDCWNRNGCKQIRPFQQECSEPSTWTFLFIFFFFFYFVHEKNARMHNQMQERNEKKKKYRKVHRADRNCVSNSSKNGSNFFSMYIRFIWKNVERNICLTDPTSAIWWCKHQWRITRKLKIIKVYCDMMNVLTWAHFIFTFYKKSS